MLGPNFKGVFAYRVGGFRLRQKGLAFLTCGDGPMPCVFSLGLRMGTSEIGPVTWTRKAVRNGFFGEIDDDKVQSYTGRYREMGVGGVTAFTMRPH